MLFQNKVMRSDIKIGNYKLSQNVASFSKLISMEQYLCEN